MAYSFSFANSDFRTQFLSYLLQLTPWAEVKHGYGHWWFVDDAVTHQSSVSTSSNLGKFC
jgi:hypothetical protein